MGVIENEIVEIKSDQNYYCYEWTLKCDCNFCDDCISNDKFFSIWSRKLATRSIMTTDWELKLSITKLQPIVLFLYLLNKQSDDDSGIYDCKIVISVKNKKGLTHFSTAYEKHNYVLTYDSDGIYIPLKFIDCSCLQNCEYMPGGVIKFVVEIFKPVKEISKVLTTTITPVKKVSEKFSDVTLVVGGREFPAHKAILAGQSSVFLAMFEHEMKESIENKVYIEDIRDEIMEIVFNFMYTQTVDEEKFEELASDVLVAADKYALEDLVKICEKFIARGLNSTNVFKGLQTAINYKLDSLKEAAVNLIAEEIEDIMKTDEFNNIVNSLDLLKEIILALKKQHQIKRM